VDLSPPANVVAYGGTAGTFTSGRPNVNASHLGGTSQTGRDIGASVLLSSGTGTGQVTLTSGRVNADVTHWGATAVATARPLVDTVQISGDSGAADALETAFDGTAGAVSPLGIARQGTAQSATSTTLVLDSSASFADDTANGMTLVACGSTQGYCQSRAVTDYVSSTDTATVSTWTVTPSGTITYYLFGTAPGSGGDGGDGSGFTAIPWNSAWDAEVESEVDDALGGGTGTALTAIPWNASWDAEVQSEATDALNAYDPPTNAELTARTLASASYATAATQSTMDGKLDTISTAVVTTIPAAVAVIDGIVDQLLIGVNVSKINDATITGDGSGTPFNVE
jgi:hypothetical protein